MYRYCIIDFNRWIGSWLWREFWCFVDVSFCDIEILVHDCPWQSPITSPRYLVQRIAMRQPDILMQSDGGSFYKATICSQLMECFWRYQLHQQISTNKSWHGLAHKSGSVERPWSYLATLQIYYKSLENPAESNSGNSLLFDLGVSSMALLTWRHAPPKNDSSQCLSDCQSWTCFQCPPSSSPFEEWTTCPRYGQPQFALPLHARVVWGVFKLIKCNFEFLVHAPNVRPCPLLMLQRSHAMSCIRLAPNISKRL